MLKRRDLYSSASRRPSVFESIATFFIGALLLYLGAGILAHRLVDFAQQHFLLGGAARG